MSLGRNTAKKYEWPKDRPSTKCLLVRRTPQRQPAYLSKSTSKIYWALSVRWIVSLDRGTEWGLAGVVKPRVVRIHSVLEGKGKVSLLVRPITKWRESASRLKQRAATLFSQFLWQKQFWIRRTGGVLVGAAPLLLLLYITWLYITLFTSLCFTSPICITKNLSAKLWFSVTVVQGQTHFFFPFFWPPQFRVPGGRVTAAELRRLW